MKKDPFGDPMEAKQRINPFGEDVDEGGVAGAATRMEQAARKIRLLKNQLGAEGLTLQATRDLIDEVSAALDAGSRALKDLSRK